MVSLEEQAIQAALSGIWEKAIEHNERILASDPANIDAHNRLAYAYSQSGDYKKACLLYQDILKKEPYNPIAQKNLLKCQQYNQNNHVHHPSNHKRPISPSLFVADAQKTRIVQLVNIAPHSVLRSISVGEAVYPFRKGFELHIRTESDMYLGTLPDDIGRKLMVLLKQDNPCECFVKDLEEHELTIFIKWHE